MELVFLRATSLRPVAAGALAGLCHRDDRPGRGMGLVARLDADPVAVRRCCPEAAVAGLIAAVAGGAVGGFIGAALVNPRPFPPLRAERLGALVAGVALMAVLGLGAARSTATARTARRCPCMT